MKRTITPMSSLLFAGVLMLFAALTANGVPKEFGVARSVADSGTTAMALALEGDRLYAGCGGSLVIYDVSCPLEPRRLGSVDGFGVVRQIAVQKGFAYVACRESGLWIVDATDPAAPRIRSRFDCCELATGVDVAGDACFLGQRQNGVEFVDVRNPDRPEHIAMRKTDESQSVKYRDGFLYSGDWGTGRVTVLDCRDLRNIRQVACESLWGYGDGVWLKGNRLYCETGHHARNRDLKTLSYKPIVTDEMRTYGREDAGGGCGHGLDIFDVTDPARPIRLGRADFPPLYTRGNDMWTPRTTAGSDMVYCCATHNGIFAVDCTDPTQPKVVDRWLCPDPKNPKVPSACVGSIAVGDGCLYAALKVGGVQVIPTVHAKREIFDQGALPHHVDFREDYPTDAKEFVVYRPDRRGQARAVAVKDDVIYAACGSAGLHVLRLAEDGSLVKLGELDGAAEVFDVQVEDDRLYTAEGLRGWAMYGLEGPARFRELKRLSKLDEMGEPALCVWKPAQDWVVVSTRRSQATFFKVDDFGTDREPSVAVGWCPGWDKYLMDRAIGGWIAYNSANKHIAWVDLNAAKKPKVTLSSPKNRLGLGDGICRLNDGKALATRGNGYFLMDPGACEPQDGKTWSLRPFPAPGVRGIPRASPDGRTVLVTCRIGRHASLLDFGDPDRPKLLKRWSLSGNPDIGAFCRGRAVIPCGHQGVVVQCLPNDDAARSPIGHFSARKPHPRLLGGAAEFAAIREKVKTDPLMGAAMKGIAARAREHAAAKSIVRKKDGRRLLKVSREALARISFCAMDARINNNATSRATAIRTMREVVTFSDWNPSHFLDVAEMCLAVSLGYDWLYDDLSVEDRESISTGLRKLGLDPMCHEAHLPRSRLRAPTNWGQVCSAGAMAVALALWMSVRRRRRICLRGLFLGFAFP